MNRDHLLDEAMVAAWLGVAPEWFKRHRLMLYRRGLPHPLPLPGRALRWDPAALDHWLDSLLPASSARSAATSSTHAGRVIANPANDRAEETGDDAGWSDILARRSRALAQGE